MGHDVFTDAARVSDEWLDRAQQYYTTDHPPVSFKDLYEPMVAEALLLAEGNWHRLEIVDEPVAVGGKAIVVWNHPVWKD